MTEPFIHHLHTIYAQGKYTYLHIYIFTTLKALKSLKQIKTLN